MSTHMETHARVVAERAEDVEPVIALLAHPQTREVINLSGQGRTPVDVLAGQREDVGLVLVADNIGLTIVYQLEGQRPQQAWVPSDLIGLLRRAIASHDSIARVDQKDAHRRSGAAERVATKEVS